MDFLDQAQGFIEKAQEKMADATTLAAWKANQAVRVKGLQKQIGEIEKNIELVTLQLGNQVFRMWKKSADGGSSDLQAEGRERTQMEDLCHQLDGLLARYRQVNADLTSTQNATYEGTVVAPSAGGQPNEAILILPPHSQPAESLPHDSAQTARPISPAATQSAWQPPTPVPNPTQPQPTVQQSPGPQSQPAAQGYTAPPTQVPPQQHRPASPPPPGAAQQGRPAPSSGTPQPTSSPRQVSDTPQQASPRSTPAPATVAQQPAPAAGPQRPQPRAKPCPSCGTTVPPDATYCPQCGYLAR